MAGSTFLPRTSPLPDAAASTSVARRRPMPSGDSRRSRSPGPMATTGGPGPSNAEIAAAHGLTEDAVKMRSMRLRKQWQRALREEVAKTVSSPEEIDPELRHLVSSIAQGG